MQDEQSFLRQYRQDDYPRPSVTADVVAFTLSSEVSDNYRRNAQPKLLLLLIKRGGHPFKGCWALPGGFLNPGETIEQCALREIEEETAVKPVSLMSIGLFSEPDRDPRGWIISNAFVSVLGAEKPEQRSGDDAADAQWFEVSFERAEDGTEALTLTHEDVSLRAVLKEEKSAFGISAFSVLDSGSLAFDHAKIIAAALTALRGCARDFEMIFDFLPEKFTLTELQNVQETILNVSMLSANFRRKIAGLVEETEEYTGGAGHRPAKLYKRKQEA